MHAKLKVSKEILAQRLLHDLRLWRACIFWGQVNYGDLKIFDKRFPGPHVLVRGREKRKSGFKRLSITQELKNSKSELRNAIVGHREEKIESYPIVVGNEYYALDMSNRFETNDAKYFVALLYDPLSI